jgi:hypothetical protein
MTHIHICTTESLRAGIESEAFECFMCGKNTMFMDWVGAKCDTCQADTSWEDNAAGLVRSVRKSTGLTRNDIAEKSGLKSSTIKSYEWKSPSNRYYQWFRRFIQEFYSKRPSN